MPLFDDYQALSFAREGRILTITMNLPDTLNAMNGRLHAEMSRVFTDANEDPDSDIVVLTGAGRCFSAGGDINWMQEAVDNPAVFKRTTIEAKRILFSQLDLEKPLIARVNGHAMGLGASLALCCDVAIAADTAKIGDPHVAVGLVAGDGGAMLWPQMIGYMRAREYLLTGDPIPATEAAAMGLLTRAVAPEALDDAVYGLARRLAAGATQAIRYTKIVTNLALKQVVHAHADAGFGYEVLTNETADHAEAVAAFRDKRKPVFTGQ
ncbi:enoyl-CoA hydratase/isomerase family protein [Arenibacterium halophilum]|uniref:Enoyl-CoA hydratase/isomerase family protein n=1 Tax=Arenibacterium halophilum TaxID=2583821 RepID=A0ABY2XC67_9RHOB|nr:enoyl-CoA hydratase-related protein [Arenibacterium halophilum]MAY85513.1 enoyl-CoA hydratase [Pseudooceanicola sp.]TMV14615.1 enoyl-CoA hydratase/isomerase family protein [Arenibacterium halophilum]